MRSVEEWKRMLREALREALREQRAPAVAALRETLAAIDNAEAADAKQAPPAQEGIIAGAVAGLGAGEVARRRLSPEAVAAVVESEIRERRDAAAGYARAGRDDLVATLRSQAELLASI